MADTFTLEIVTPLGILVSEDTTEVTAPGTEGEFGVLSGHTDYITALRPGVVCYKKDGEDQLIVVGGGYAEVAPDKTNILVDYAELAASIDAVAAAEELKTAEAALAETPFDDSHYAKRKEAVYVAEAKISGAEKAKK